MDSSLQFGLFNYIFSIDELNCVLVGFINVGVFVFPILAIKLLMGSFFFTL